MARTAAELKIAFENGKIPVGQDYAELIDMAFNVIASNNGVAVWAQADNEDFIPDTKLAADAEVGQVLTFTSSGMSWESPMVSGGGITQIQADARYYTQDAADAKFALKTDIPNLTPYATIAGLAAYYLKTDADAKFALKTDIPSLTNYYTKSEVDAAIAAIPSPDLSGYYLKTEADARFASISHTHAFSDITGTISPAQLASGGAAGQVLSTTGGTNPTLQWVAPGSGGVTQRMFGTLVDLIGDPRKLLDTSGNLILGVEFHGPIPHSGGFGQIGFVNPGRVQSHINDFTRVSGNINPIETPDFSGSGLTYDVEDAIDTISSVDDFIFKIYVQNDSTRTQTTVEFADSADFPDGLRDVEIDLAPGETATAVWRRVSEIDAVDPTAPTFAEKLAGIQGTLVRGLDPYVVKYLLDNGLAFIDGTRIIDESIEGGKLKDGAVGNDQLAIDAVATSNIQDESVTDAKLNSDVKLDAIPDTLTSANENKLPTAEAVKDYVDNNMSEGLDYSSEFIPESAFNTAALTEDQRTTVGIPSYSGRIPISNVRANPGLVTWNPTQFARDTVTFDISTTVTFQTFPTSFYGNLSTRGQFHYIIYYSYNDSESTVTMEDDSSIPTNLQGRSITLSKGEWITIVFEKTSTASGLAGITAYFVKGHHPLVLRNLGIGIDGSRLLNYTVIDRKLSSGASTDGQVLTSDGFGGVAWDTPDVTSGPPGAQGPPGPAGSDGLPGARGPQGEVGPAGPQGERGIDGPAGAKGDDGDAGPEGPAGPQGEIGPPGPAGSDGDPGKDGDPGPAGPQGPQGETGPAPVVTVDEVDTSTVNLIVDGTRSDVNIKGPAGERGLTGPTGPPGGNANVGEGSITEPLLDISNSGSTGDVLTKDSGDAFRWDASFLNVDIFLQSSVNQLGSISMNGEARLTTGASSLTGDSAKQAHYTPIFPPAADDVDTNVLTVTFGNSFVNGLTEDGDFTFYVLRNRDTSLTYKLTTVLATSNSGDVPSGLIFTEREVDTEYFIFFVIRQGGNLVGSTSTNFIKAILDDAYSVRDHTHNFGDLDGELSRSQLESGVQDSLDLADSSIQDLSSYYTRSESDDIFSRLTLDDIIGNPFRIFNTVGAPTHRSGGVPGSIFGDIFHGPIPYGNIDQTPDGGNKNTFSFLGSGISNDDVASGFYNDLLNHRC